MNTEMTNTILATEEDAPYDASAKQLLGRKHILAHILVKAVKEFHGMNPKDVIPLIEYCDDRISKSIGIITRRKFF